MCSGIFISLLPLTAAVTVQAVSGANSTSDTH